MKKFIIESRVQRTETAEVTANSKEDAIKFAENNPHINWKGTGEEPERVFISLMEGEKEPEPEEPKDLFEFYEEQPKALKIICDKWFDKLITDGLNYNDCKDFQLEVEAIGYTFDYSLDAEPIDLRLMEPEPEPEPTPEPENEKFARKCSATGKGMNEGYCFGDGIWYCISEEDAIKEIKKDIENGTEFFNEDNEVILNKDNLGNFKDDEIFEISYNNDYHYYTNWEVIEEDETYFDAEGNEFTICYKCKKETEVIENFNFCTNCLTHL